MRITVRLLFLLFLFSNKLVQGQKVVTSPEMPQRGLVFSVVFTPAKPGPATPEGTINDTDTAVTMV
ncbi:MAG: hypothetical protein ABI151_10240, partial [Chitinophagaceae bacterium]